MALAWEAPVPWRGRGRGHQGAGVPLRVAAEFGVQLLADPRPLPVQEPRRQGDVPAVRRGHQAGVAALSQRPRRLEGRQLHAGGRRGRRRSHGVCRHRCLRRPARTTVPLGHGAARQPPPRPDPRKLRSARTRSSVAPAPSPDSDVGRREEKEDPALGGCLAAILCVACGAKTKPDLAFASSVL